MKLVPILSLYAANTQSSYTDTQPIYAAEFFSLQTLDKAEREEQHELLHVFEFSSVTKRMGLCFLV